MTGERDLDRLLSQLHPELDPEVYVFSTIQAGAPPQGLNCLMQFHEAEGLTLILPKPEAMRLGLDWIFPCRRITLRVHSALDAVGLIARISAALAEAGIAANPVAGYHHDHLFIAEDRAERALAVIRELSNPP